MTDRDGLTLRDTKRSLPTIPNKPSSEAPVLYKRPEWIDQKIAEFTGRTNWWEDHQFIVHFKRDKLKTPLYARDLECLNKWNFTSPGADIVRDAALYESGQRDDYDVFEKLYGVRTCDWSGHYDRYFWELAVLLEDHANVVASTRYRCTARFHESYAEYVAALKAAAPFDYWFCYWDWVRLGPYYDLENPDDTEGTGDTSNISEGYENWGALGSDSGSNESCMRPKIKKLMEAFCAFKRACIEELSQDTEFPDRPWI